MNLCKKLYQKKYWLNKAIQYGIPTEGRELEAAKEAEAQYRKEYRHKKAQEVRA